MTIQWDFFQKELEHIGFVRGEDTASTMWKFSNGHIEIVVGFESLIVERPGHSEDIYFASQKLDTETVLRIARLFTDLAKMGV